MGVLGIPGVLRRDCTARFKDLAHIPKRAVWRFLPWTAAMVPECLGAKYHVASGRACSLSFETYRLAALLLLKAEHMSTQRRWPLDSRCPLFGV